MVGSDTDKRKGKSDGVSDLLTRVDFREIGAGECGAGAGKYISGADAGIGLKEHRVFVPSNGRITVNTSGRESFCCQLLF